MIHYEVVNFMNFDFCVFKVLQCSLFKTKLLMHPSESRNLTVISLNFDLHSFLYMQTAKVLLKLHRCTDSAEYLQLVDEGLLVQVTQEGLFWALQQVQPWKHPDMTEKLLTGM